VRTVSKLIYCACCYRDDPGRVQRLCSTQVGTIACVWLHDEGRSAILICDKSRCYKRALWCGRCPDQHWWHEVARQGRFCLDWSGRRSRSRCARQRQRHRCRLRQPPLPAPISHCGACAVLALHAVVSEGICKRAGRSLVQKPVPLIFVFV
jgi:hypothetical protein